MPSTEQLRQTVQKSGGSAAGVPDRRVRRTRKLLQDAFISLVIEKGYEKTTIQDILDRADVGRSTFYVHYRDKEALLTANFDAMHEQLEHELDQIAAAGPIDVALPAALLFEHAFRNQLLAVLEHGRLYMHGLQGEALAGNRLAADVARANDDALEEFL